MFSPRVKKYAGNWAKIRAELSQGYAVYRDPQRCSFEASRIVFDGRFDTKPIFGETTQGKMKTIQAPAPSPSRLKNLRLTRSRVNAVCPNSESAIFSIRMLLKTAWNKFLRVVGVGLVVLFFIGGACEPMETQHFPAMSVTGLFFFYSVPILFFVGCYSFGRVFLGVMTLKVEL